MDKIRLMEEVKSVALAAGKETMLFFRRPDLKIFQKEDDSPITLADRSSNRIICDALARLAPEIPIISEENQLMPFSIRKDYTYAWLVDPLDGTREFVAGKEDFTVNIALLYGSRPLFGVVCVPALDEIYWAARGKGAFGVYDGKLQRLHAAMFHPTDAGLRVLCSRSHFTQDTDAFIHNLNAPVSIHRGSALKFMLLARGEADLYPRIGPTMEWDTAAAQIIVEEAGGWVVDMERKMPLVYNKEHLQNPNFLAAGKSATNPSAW